MKISLTILVCFVVLRVFSQDTTYYDDRWNEVSSAKYAEYIKVVERNADNQDEAVEKIFFINGQLRSVEVYSSYKENKLNGKRKEWYRNGQLRKNIEYTDGKLDGEIITYYDNGQMRRHDYYKNGEFIKGTCWASDGKETQHFDFRIMPEFPGGINQLVRYIAENTRYPRKMEKSNLQGKVIVSFNIDKKGNVTDVKIHKGINKAFDKEALRVVKNMPKWKPGMEDGEFIVVNFFLPLSFKVR